MKTLKQRWIMAGSLLLACTTLLVPLNAADPDPQARQDAVIVRALERLDGFDYRQSPGAVAAVLREIDRAAGTPRFVELVKRFQPDGIEKRLLASLNSKNQSAAVESAELLLDSENGRKLIRQRLAEADTAISTISVLGLLGNGRAVAMLSNVAENAELPFDQRRSSVAALARNKAGQQKLVELATKKTLVGDTLLVAGALLSRSNHQDVKQAAAKVLPQPALDDRPLPPVDQLAKLSGDAKAGQVMFRGKGTCANCHIVSGFGKDVGPNLSEIGNKLSREAMITAVLLPSAGISHNYENFSVLTDDGQVITGLKISETDQQVVIRTADAIDRKISKDQVELIRKSEKSIMPENLHHLTGQQGLIDVVEYMTTLKKKP